MDILKSSKHSRPRLRFIQGDTEFLEVAVEHRRWRRPCCSPRLVVWSLHVYDFMLSELYSSGCIVRTVVLYQWCLNCCFEVNGYAFYLLAVPSSS
jgi:hypothetical protein